VVEKEREKDLGKVVTGGGEGTEAEGTEKANHREHGGHGEKQTTEDTEDTEMGREGRTRWSAPTRRGIGLSRGRWVKGAQVGWKAGPTRRACPTGGGGLRWSAQSCGPRRQSWRRLAIGTPVLLGIVSLCRRDRRHGKPGGLLHIGGRRVEVERAVVRAGWRWNSRIVRDCVALPA